MRKLTGMTIAAVLLVAGCTDEATGSGTHAVDIASLEVTDSTPVDAHGLLRLSPDGDRVLSWSAGDTCAIPLDGGDKQCVAPDTSIDVSRAQWSPDGSMIAFTDDFWRLLDEPDLRVFDVATGDTRDLTDDGTDANILQDPSDDALVDLLPSWSADGRKIRFARGVGEDKVMLMEIDATGGEPTELRSIDVNIREITALAWSPDGNTVAWTTGISGGVVHLGSTTGDDDTVVMPEKAGRDNTALSFAADNSALLVDSLQPYGSFSTTTFDSARVVPVGEDSEPRKVADVESVGYPSWSPTGHGIAFVGSDGLYVVPEPGGEPRRLAEGERFAGPDMIRLSWAATSMLAYRDGEPTLLHLSQ